MSELLTRLERAFIALTKPLPVALPAPDRTAEIEELRTELEQTRNDRQRDLAQQDLTRAALKSAHDDVEQRDNTIAELRAALEQATRERDEARRTVGDRDELVETLRAEIDAASQADQPASNAGPDEAAIAAAAVAAAADVGGSLEYVAPERLVEYTRKVFEILESSNDEETDNADRTV